MESYHNLTLPSNGSAQLGVPTAVVSRALRQTSGNVRNGSLESYRVAKSKPIVPSQSRAYAKSSADARSKLTKIGSQTTRVSKGAVNGDEYKYIYDAHVSKPRRLTKAFLDYREKPRRPSRRTGEPVWPDVIEEAFHEALDIIGPKGRKKTMYRGKLMGGNELIAEFIKDRTGHIRLRKQVSSHIQVLKKFNAQDPEFMNKVTAKASTPNNTTVKPYHNEAPHGILSSNEPNTEYVAIEPTELGHRAQYTGLSTPHVIDPEFGASSSTQGGVLGLDFKMWVEPRQAIPMAQPQRHVYTQVGLRNRCSSVDLDSVRDWRSRFPKLASLELRRDIDCEIILLETSLNFVSDYPPQNSTLGVQFQVSLSDQYAFNHWECDTNIYTEGGEICAVSRSCSVKQLTRQKLALPEEDSAHERDSITITPQFHSAFWSELFTKLMHKRASYDRNGDVDGLRRQAAATRKCIRNISAMQELYVVPSNGNSTPQRVAIFLWKFRQADPDESGTTIWRNLIPPPSQILTNSSISPEPHQPMSLQGALQESALESAVNYVDSFDGNELNMLGDPSNTVPEAPALMEGMEYAASSFASTQGSGQLDTTFTGGHIDLYFEPAPLDTYDDDAPCFSQPTDSTLRYEHPQPEIITQYEHPQNGSAHHYDQSQHDSIPQYEHSQPDSVPHYNHPQHDDTQQYEHPQHDSIQQYEQYEHTSWLNYGSLFTDPNHHMPEPAVESMIGELC
ncbi:MAG: hypothetical protein M1812_003535 [Candelaria pacifica]|nr:MAG: hypothetical protein M1812_003535 [Candelaria pacifica]